MSAQLDIIRNLLQNNVVGSPVVHKTTEWEFDPEVSLKRRDQFYEVIKDDTFANSLWLSFHILLICS